MFEPSLFISESVFNNLHQELQAFCLPFDYRNKNIIYKLYTTDVSIETVEQPEEEILDDEFSLFRVITMKDQTNDLLQINFEFLIELLNSTNHVCINISSTVRTLAKLAFNFIFLNDYKKASMIIEDTIKLFDRNDPHDSVYLSKLKLINKKLQEKIKKISQF